MLVAFTTRVVARVLAGEAAYLRSGYTFYLTIARTFVDGDGLCMATAAGCARRMPLYPLLIAPFAAVGHLFPWLPIVQAASGAATVWVGWKLALEIADQRAALPLRDPPRHGTAGDVPLQLAGGGRGLLAAVLRRRAASGVALGAGGALDLAMLTTGRIGLFLPCAVAWLAVSAPGIQPRRALAVWMAIPILLSTGGWAVRNWLVVGAPVLSTEVGQNLWVVQQPVDLLALSRGQHRCQPGRIVPGGTAGPAPGFRLRGASRREQLL